MTIFFIVQPGSLSLRARFLAASLRRFLPPPQPIHAFVPTRDAGLERGTRAFLDAMEVELRPFEAELWPRFDYPIGNKIDAARQGFATPHALFLDTDILCLSRPPLARIAAQPLAATPVLGTKPYAGAGAAPIDRFAAGLGVMLAPQPAGPDGVLPGMALYNSGVVGFDTRAGLADRWFEAAVAVFGADLPEGVKRPYADQVSLAALAALQGEGVRVLMRAWNRPPALDKPRGHNGEAIFLHYFRIGSLLAHDGLRRRLRALHERHAPAGHNLLGELTPRDLGGLRAAAAGRD